MLTDALQLAHKDTVDARDIGLLIRKARDKRGWKQEALAHDVGCSAAYITNLERGHMVPTVEMSIKLEQSLTLHAGTLSALVVKHRIQQAVATILRESTDLGVDTRVRLSFMDDAVPKRN